MKKIFNFLLILFVMILSSCGQEPEEEVILPGNDRTSFNETEGQRIPVLSVSAPLSTIEGHLEAFEKYEKKIDEFPVTFKSSLLKTHQLEFTFDGVYPIDKIFFTNGIEPVTKMHIDLSFNGNKFDRKFTNYTLTSNTNEINLNGSRAKAVRFTFDTNKNYQIKDIYFTLALGVIVRENTEWTNSFLRTSGWSGADGIYAFDLNGNDKPGFDYKTAFVFSDTFIGQVNPNNMVRRNSTMINNSIGYYDPEKPFEEAFSFDWNLEGITPRSIFNPNSYMGKRLSNLLDSNGVEPSYSPSGKLTNVADGTQFLKTGNQAEIVIDLKDEYQVKSIYLWNFNETPNYGASNYTLHISNDGEAYNEHSNGNISLASGNDKEAYTLKLDLNTTTRHIKLAITNNNDHIGLGKIVITDNFDNPLYGKVTGTETDLEPTALDRSTRLWIQDGVVLGDYLYLFPIVVKDFETIFQVYGVGVIQVPIVNGELDHQNSIYHQAPLQTNTENGGTIFMGGALMNHVEYDGYVYIFGYKDPGRKLITGRFKPEDVLNFNEYEYWNGTQYVKNINQAKGDKGPISAEFSVTYIEEGLFAGKFMMVVMENTTSGKISYALSDQPYGSYGEFEQIYQTSESTMYTKAFTYNAKMHPNLSEPGHWLITYNVNSNSLSALADARIYHPRVIEMIEVKPKE